MRRLCIGYIHVVKSQRDEKNADARGNVAELRHMRLHQTSIPHLPSRPTNLYTPKQKEFRRIPSPPPSKQDAASNHHNNRAPHRIIAAGDIPHGHLRVGARVERRTVVRVRGGEGVDVVGAPATEVEVGRAGRVQHRDRHRACPRREALLRVPVRHVVGVRLHGGGDLRGDVPAVDGGAELREFVGRRRVG